MENKSPNDWPWPEELDALVAAPMHHSLLLENEFVRVVETIILPGEITAIHTHQWPAALNIISWADFIRYDGNGNITADSRNLHEADRTGTALWSEPLKPHSLKNVGDKIIHIISTEIKI
ncbi:MAG: hypothetical protein PSV36_15060 [Algoriphagus sp.]|nr:hypothetical protein [Algoriphagus sp.]